MWTLGGHLLKNRLILGTAQYPSPEILRQAILQAQVEVVTLSLRRHSPETKGGQAFWEFIQSCPVKILPNTAGCYTAKEAITIAHMARDLFETSWIKLEVIGDSYYLQPDPFGLLEAASVLLQEGFQVLPYTTEDLVLAKRLIDVGCNTLMPWGSLIGSGKGISNPTALKALRNQFPQTTLILDAGIGAPSHAAYAMELGFDGVLLNTAVALAKDPPSMAGAFAKAVEAGRQAYEAGLMVPRDFAVVSTPIVGTPFWHVSK